MAGKEEKKAFVLRMNPRTLKALEKWAGDEFRSVNGQIEYLLLQSLKNAGRAPKASGKKDEQSD